jgi:uncharacterized protein with NAD-binding domain and iron-sulfur cluster
MAALTLAFWLTEQPNWQDRFEIVVLQPGWRLGGKLASGRNTRVHDRIEEHGLHVWSGFYENAFAVIQRVYEALGRKPSEPLATWEEAFTPWSEVSWAQHFTLGWGFLATVVPENKVKPGSGGMLATPTALLGRMVRFAHQFLSHPPIVWQPMGRPHRYLASSLLFALRGVIALERVLGARVVEALLWLSTPLVLVSRLLVHGAIDRSPEQAGLTLEALAIADLALAYVQGFRHDHVLAFGFDRINDSEFTEWLRRYGLHERTLGSGFVRSAYCYLFAFGEGDPEKPKLEAGTAMRMIFRLLLASATAIFWRMNAGAGDTVIAPLYLVLKDRGVEFRFFHKVREVRTDSDGAVTEVEIGRQVTVQPKPGESGYDPLVDVGGLPCWPSEPEYAQIVQAAELKRREVDLESYWTDWHDVERESLLRGGDFDVLVWGASLAALPPLAPSLLEQSEPLRRAVAAVPTVATESMQLWLDVATAALGGPADQTILTGFAEPFDTWADLSHLLARESWPPATRPLSVQYFCGVLGGAADPPSAPDPAYATGEAEVVEGGGRNFLDKHGGRLWPGISRNGGFDWSVLHAEQPGDRFVQQFWRANIDPSELYAQSPPGSAAARPTVAGTDVDGLLVVGDWVRTGLNYGCIEAAVMSGLAAARALCGSPEYVYGESDFPPFRGPA